MSKTAAIPLNEWFPKEDTRLFKSNSGKAFELEFRVGMDGVKIVRSRCPACQFGFGYARQRMIRWRRIA